MNEGTKEKIWDLYFQDYRIPRIARELAITNIEVADVIIDSRVTMGQKGQSDSFKNTAVVAKY